MAKNLTLSRVFNAPMDKVWAAWVESDKVKKWWGPMGFTCPVAEMDVTEGGTSLVCMRAPKEFGGMDMYNTWTYTKVEPGKRLEYVLRFTDKDGKAGPAPQPGLPEEVPHVIEFEETDGKTKVTVTEKGYASDEIVEMSRQGMEQCFDKMAKIVE